MNEVTHNATYISVQTLHSSSHYGYNVIPYQFANKKRFLTNGKRKFIWRDLGKGKLLVSYIYTSSFLLWNRLLY